jgi:hypothetical protein
MDIRIPACGGRWYLLEKISRRASFSISFLISAFFRMDKYPDSYRDGLLERFSVKISYSGIFFVLRF